MRCHQCGNLSSISSTLPIDVLSLKVHSHDADVAAFFGRNKWVALGQWTCSYCVAAATAATMAMQVMGSDPILVPLAVAN